MTALAVTVPLAAATTAEARTEPSDAVIAWNVHAQTAIYENARQPPTTAARSFAVVQGAVYDAVNAIAGSPYEPLVTAPRSRRGDSTPAAVAAAAHDVLLWMFPAQEESLDAQYDEALAAVPDGRAERGGVAVGEAAAAAMIDSRRDDGFDPAAPWPVGAEPGDWRPTPPGYIGVGAWTPFLKPFVIRDAGDYPVKPPPALTSAAWARDLNEVKAVGSAGSTVRTQDQKEAAIWWDDPRQVEWAIGRQLATTHGLGALQTARMLAMVYVTAIDALIPCYAAKLRYSLWRPVTAIPLAGTDGNPATGPEEGWTPLRGTAPSPEYPSGHACFTTATMAALRVFFGRDDVSFGAASADSGTTRHFDSLAAAAREVQGARIWAGVHYRSAVEEGDILGREVARDVLDRAFVRRR
ncbi:vanadium-dependent haloperoxidase [Streptomyces smaragdinus]|uniref:vanadium-dependent haloperoxidase n=1 Tax=Streptomyces smaragdinus TaxID=2585196 RepID=UPI002B219826|nr:vanadium-dependent haloperoxidase [Streptomyces smaragdinus]